jgi:hypothetical protein
MGGDALAATEPTLALLQVDVGQGGDSQVFEWVAQAQRTQAIAAGMVLVRNVKEVGAAEVIGAQRFELILQGQRVAVDEITSPTAMVRGEGGRLAADVDRGQGLQRVISMALAGQGARDATDDQGENQ